MSDVLGSSPDTMPAARSQAGDRHLTSTRPVTTSAVGVTFVDVLFALVIAQVLTPFADTRALPWVGRVQLILAGFLTVASWIGYHNSWNRPKYFIRFPNWPLAQFLIDVLLVVVYFLCAITAPGVQARTNPDRSIIAIIVLVALSFTLYAAWDWVSLQIRKGAGYALRTEERDIPARRRVSYCFAILGWLFVVGVWYFKPDTSFPAISIEVSLIALIICYRFVKEYVTPPSVSMDEVS